MKAGVSSLFRVETLTKELVRGLNTLPSRGREMWMVWWEYFFFFILLQPTNAKRTGLI